MTTFDSAPSDTIALGCCLILRGKDDDTIVYAGPVNGAPDVTDRFVLLNPADFESFKAYVRRKRGH